MTSERKINTSLKSELPHQNGRHHEKVCMVVYLPSPLALPPMYNGAVSLSNYGFRVEAICTVNYMKTDGIETKEPGFTVRRVPLLSVKFFHRRFGTAPSNIFIAIAQYLLSYTEFVMKASFAAFRASADLYEAHDLPALLPTMIAAKIRRKPIAYHAHELYPEMHAKVRFAGFWKFMERTLVPLANTVVTPEENRSQIYFDEYRAGTLPLTIQNCPPYMAPAQSTTLRDALSSKGIRFSKIVLYQGLFDSSRCIEEIIASADHLDDGVVMALMGHGFKDWQKIVETLAIPERVIMLPRVPYDQLFAYTASADIGVMFYRNNCRNNYYCAPNKLYEYMMMGIPFVTVDYPGMRKVVEGENIGLCVNPEKPAEIAAALNRLAGDAKLYREMKNNCLRLAREKYNWEIEFQKLLQKYRTILDSKLDYISMNYKSRLAETEPKGKP